MCARCEIKAEGIILIRAAHDTLLWVHNLMLQEVRNR